MTPVGYMYGYYDNAPFRQYTAAVGALKILQIRLTVIRNSCPLASEHTVHAHDGYHIIQVNPISGALSALSGGGGGGGAGGAGTAGVTPCYTITPCRHYSEAGTTSAGGTRLRRISAARVRAIHHSLTAPRDRRRNRRRTCTRP